MSATAPNQTSITMIIVTSDPNSRAGAMRNSVPPSGSGVAVMAELAMRHLVRRDRFGSVPLGGHEDRQLERRPVVDAAQLSGDLHAPERGVGLIALVGRRLLDRNREVDRNAAADRRRRRKRGGDALLALPENIFGDSPALSGSLDDAFDRRQDDAVTASGETSPRCSTSAWNESPTAIGSASIVQVDLPNFQARRER